MNKPQYIKWLVEEKDVKFADGQSLKCYKLDYEIEDQILNDWALHIRKHYISDKELFDSVEATCLTAEEYLREYVVPQKSDQYGPVSRSNDITEILVSDLLQFILNFSVPRCKQDTRSGKSLSEHGVDIIAYKFFSDDKKPHKDDKLIISEVKAMLTSKDSDVICKAIKDSKKDSHRFSHTLDFYRKKLKHLGKNDEANEISRFQLKTEQNYKLGLIAAAVSSQEEIQNSVIANINGGDLFLEKNQRVFYIHGKTLMNLAHEIFERCVK